jgi:cellobiose-specific phosphotransferase system component IIC
MALFDCSNNFKFKNFSEKMKKLQEKKLESGSVYFGSLMLLILSVFGYFIYVYYNNKHKFGTVSGMVFSILLFVVLFSEYFSLNAIKSGNKDINIKPGRGFILDVTFIATLAGMYLSRKKPIKMPPMPMGMPYGYRPY